MKTLSLNGAWTATPRGGGYAVPARVPGDIVADLIRAGRLADPYYRRNEQDAQWIGEVDWIYERAFDAPAALRREASVRLQCDGLDTLATVQLNGRTVARTDNMHRRYEWEVKPLLRAGRNTIRVVFAAVNPYTRRRHRRRPFRARVHEGHPSAYPAWVRKEACNFGWDWGPILVTCGIWRGLRLVGFSTGRQADVRIAQEHAPDRVRLDVEAQIEALAPGPFTVRAAVLRRGRVVARQAAAARGRRARLELPIRRPELWWPRGLGRQPLYEVRVELCDRAGRVLDVQTRRIGLRTLRLDRHPDAWGESFQFVVNGVPFFAKGANWIPLDAVLARREPARYRRLVADAAAANMNMLRVWGGGIYEDDAFYDACDELGLCVWQDFMFACMAYPTFDRAFLETVEAEARDNVRRLRHHPCLALWCGNNEMEQQAVGLRGSGGKMSWRDYRRLFDRRLARVVRELAGDTDYWPSSPHSPRGDRADFNNPRCGDAHLWNVWHGRAPFEWYRTCGHRFNSEFGFQAFPEPKTVRGFTARRDRNVTTAVMEHHQRSGIGNSTILQYLLSWFRLPTSFEMLLWTSQILQGLAIKYAVEHWRRSRPRGMGTLYWQLNDCWPAVSWSSIDYHGRWKALHYLARRFFAPVLASGLEDAATGRVELHVTSDRLAPVPVRLRWVVTDAAGRRLRAGGRRLRAPAQSNRRVATLRLADLLQARGAHDLLLWLEWTAPGQPRATEVLTLARPKHLELAEDPGLRAAVAPQRDGSFQVRLRARRPALWTWLELRGVDARLSDNFLHLRPGRPALVRAVPARRMTAAEFRRRLRICSLADTYREPA